MKLRSSVVTALAAAMCFTLMSTHATPSSPKADAGETSRVSTGISADTIDPARSTAVTHATGAAVLEDTAAPTPLPAPLPLADAPVTTPPPRGDSFTLRETTSWMHVDPALAASPWAGETALDRPDVFARAMKMYTRPLGDATWTTGLSTAGSGSEESADGVDVRVATVGHGDGDASGAALGPRAVGVAANGTEHGHRARGISLHDVDVEMTRGAPREIVQGIVRQNFTQFSACYAPALIDTPNLRGRVVVRFVIAPDGSVEVAQDAGSDLANPAVVNCVVRRFLPILFPRPDNGKMTVIYPLVFSPDAPSPPTPVTPVTPADASTR